MNLAPDELATVLAALRFYVEKGQGEPHNRSDAIHDIATNCGQVVSLDAAAIDLLIKRLNMPNSPELMYNLSIVHRRGTQTYLFRSDAERRAKLAKWVRKWWPVTIGAWGPDSSALNPFWMPQEQFDALSDENAIDVYFKAARDEYFNCKTLELEA